VKCFADFETHAHKSEEIASIKFISAVE
jgi:hypothetical protein